jgi:hypothetical protein
VAEQPGDPPETAVEGPADLVGERATRGGEASG